jgi:alpha-ketoglutaric semialdehyde dehydrogenase
MLHDAGIEISPGLVADARIKAAGFTGSRRGGLALAGHRPGPSRADPVLCRDEQHQSGVLLLPAALKARGAAIAPDFVAALTQGAGQFCTNPGLILAIDGPELDAFLAPAAKVIAKAPAGQMLTPGICKAYTQA